MEKEEINMSKKQEAITLNQKITKMNPDGTVRETYREVKIGKTLYCVTSVYKGEINLQKALEDLAIRRIFSGARAQEQINK